MVLAKLLRCSTDYLLGVRELRGSGREKKEADDQSATEVPK